MKALLVIDIQNDFCKNGALEVKDAESILDYVNKEMDKYDLVVGTKDWHPSNHKSFASNNNKNIGEFIELNGAEQIMWPDHCVKGSFGAKFHDKLNVEGLDFVFSKGSNPEVDSYSGFFENDQKTSTGLGEFLKLKNVTEVVVVGLALDYCVKFTALDAVKCGFKTTLDLNGTRAVNMNEGDDLKSIEEMKEKGVIIKN